MTEKTTQLFLEKVYDLANKRCGSEFGKEMTFVLAERERLLMNHWERIPLEEAPLVDKRKLFREIDFDTIRIKATKYLKQMDYPSFLFDIADMAIGFGELDKAKRLLKLVVTKYARSASKSLLAKSHHRLGIVAFYKNDFQMSRTHLRSSLHLYSQLEDAEGVATAQNALGNILLEQGRPSKAESFFMEAKKLAESAGLRDLLAKIEMNLGIACTMRGKWEKAIRFHEKSVATLGKRQNDDTRARIFHNLAIIFIARGEFEKALEHLHESIEYSTRANNRYIESLSYLEEAEVYCRQGDFVNATALATRSFQIFSKLGDRLSMGDAYKVLGMINREAKQFNIALSFLENSRRINEDYRNPLNLGETLLELGKLYKELGSPRKASERIGSAIRCFERIEAEARVSEAKLALAGIPA